MDSWRSLGLGKLVEKRERRGYERISICAILFSEEDQKETRLLREVLENRGYEVGSALAISFSPTLTREKKAYNRPSNLLGVDMSEDRGVLFADISDSSRLLQSLGDEAARELVKRILDHLAGVVGNRSGRVVDDIGDELMCLFPRLQDLATAAFEMQRSLRDLVISGELETPVSIRIGLHFGPVIEEDGNIFGETIYTAHRMATLAKGQQILTTQDTLERLGPTSPFPSRFVDTTTIKGKRGRFEVHELIWDTEEMTWAPGTPRSSPLEADRLEVCHADIEIQLDESRPVLTIGRGADCDLTVDDHSVSRHHARIELRKGSFVLVDHSTNGCFVLLMGREWLQVHRDERRLGTSGIIVLGPERDGKAVLHYRTLDLDATIG